MNPPLSNWEAVQKADSVQKEDFQHLLHRFVEKEMPMTALTSVPTEPTSSNAIQLKADFQNILRGFVAKEASLTPADLLEIPGESPCNVMKIEGEFDFSRLHNHFVKADLDSFVIRGTEEDEEESVASPKSGLFPSLPPNVPNKEFHQLLNKFSSQEYHDML